MLGHDVREKKVLPLMDALTKMTWQPAQRLENQVPRRHGIPVAIRWHSYAGFGVADGALQIDLGAGEQGAASEGVVGPLASRLIIRTLAEAPVG